MVSLIFISLFLASTSAAPLDNGGDEDDGALDFYSDDGEDGAMSQWCLALFLGECPWISGDADDGVASVSRGAAGRAVAKRAPREETPEEFINRVMEHRARFPTPLMGPYEQMMALFRVRKAAMERERRVMRRRRMALLEKRRKCIKEANVPITTAYMRQCMFGQKRN